MKESILISIIIVFIYIFLFFNKNRMVYVETNTGTKYMVQDFKDKQTSANLLANIVQNMYKLKNHLVRNKSNYPEYSEYIDLLNRNFTESRTTIYETDRDSDLTSYSINKGEELSFCLKSKKTGQFHDINLLMYVAIHEMAHMACPEIGHGTLFKRIFRFLVQVAITLNIYNNVDYSNSPVEYCGMVLSSSIL
jgi:predicted metal-dependent hydrolase